MTWLWVILSFSAGFIVSSIINIGKMSELYDEIDELYDEIDELCDEIDELRGETDD